jgi:serine/threonine protein kinase
LDGQAPKQWAGGSAQGDLRYGKAARVDQRRSQVDGEGAAPNILECQDSFSVDGRFYIVTELPFGPVESLAAHRDMNRWDCGEFQAIEICRQLASALTDVHCLRILHRALHPLNILCLSDRTVKLAFWQDDSFRYEPFRQAPPPEPGLPYRSPEHFSGSYPDMRGDIWALGVVCYELLTGELPFRSVVEILVSPPPSLSGKCSPELENLILRMLDKDMDERPPACSVKDEFLRLGLPRVIWLRKGYSHGRDDEYLRWIQGEFGDHVRIVRERWMSQALREINGAKQVGRLGGVYVIVEVGVGDGGTAMGEACGQIRRFQEEGVRTPILLTCGSTEGLPAMLNVIVDTRDVAIPDYLRHVVMQNE